MPIRLSDEELDELRYAFRDCLNYISDDPEEPIDPLTYQNPDGDTCLHIAAQRGDIRSIELLIKAGLDVNKVGDMGCVPLHYASISGASEVVHMLIKNGASVEILNAFGKLPVEK
ncbi:ankyrin repeat domain-containing protein [Pseudomonas leptonychotis]|uniref:ankyrin repeat domain-containing protein n=1 Tax=Pseudomonas leptonychotis TaxID=2448482 RepID=UPI00386CBE44